MPITKGYRQLVDEAMAEVTTCSVEGSVRRIGPSPEQNMARHRKPAP